jgi:hypothetical protein
VKKLTRKSKIKTHTPVLVKWRDSCDYGGWYYPERWIERVNEKDYNFGLEATAVGMFLHWNDKGIALHMLLNDGGGNTTGLIFEVPDGIISEVWELE